MKKYVCVFMAYVTTKQSRDLEKKVKLRRKTPKRNDNRR